MSTHFPRHPMLATALYSLGITLGTAIPAAVAAPLRDATGSWPVALAVWAAFALAAVVVLWPAARNGENRPARPLGSAAPPWRERRAWQIALFFAGVSAVFYVILAWLAPAYEDHGWSATHAGLLLTLLTVVQALATLALLWRARRMRDRRPALVISLAMVAVGLLGVAVTPYSAPLLWATLIGAGNGILFPVMLVLPVDYAQDAGAVARLAGMSFGLGFLLGSVGPVLAGGLRDLTGTYGAPFAAYAGVCVLLMPLAIRFAPQPLRLTPVP